MKTDYEIRKNIMRRVWMMYILRQVTSPALRGGALLGALFVLTQVVSVRDIVANALGTSGVQGLMNLAYSAITTTESGVLTLTILAVLLIGWFVVDQVRMLATAEAYTA